MPKVSIIVPVYNKEKYLEETIASIQKQTLKDIEIILIDDGSTDKSGDLCDKIQEKDSRIKVIHQKNVGVCEARNNGIEIATGEYIGLVDADDLVKEDMYEILYHNAIENNAEVSIISSAVKTLKGKEIYFYNTKQKYIWNSYQALESFFKGNLFDISACTKLFKKELAKKIKFEKDKKINEDKFYVYQTIKNANTICFEDTCKYIYIKRENSASTSKFSKKKFDAIYFANKIHKEIELTEDKELIEKSYVDNYKTKLLILRGMYRDKDALKKFEKEKIEIMNDIKTIDLKKHKFSIQKKIEIIILQKFSILYTLLVKVFDVLFR